MYNVQYQVFCSQDLDCNTIKMCHLVLDVHIIYSIWLKYSELNINYCAWNVQVANERRTIKADEMATFKAHVRETQTDVQVVCWELK